MSSGDVIAEVETDKATMEMEAFEEGVLTEIFVHEGTKVAVGEKDRLVGAGTAAAAKPASQPRRRSQRHPPPGKPPSKPEKPWHPPPPAATSSPKPPASPMPATLPRRERLETPAADNGGDRVKARPLAKKIAAAQGVTLGGLTGSGPGGRIIQSDVLGAAAAPWPRPCRRARLPPRSGPESRRADIPASAARAPRRRAPSRRRRPRIPLSGMRKTIADRLLQSKTQIPHFYLHIGVDAAALTRLRAEINTAAEKDGMKVSVNDFILKARPRHWRRAEGQRFVCGRSVVDSI